jgi:hypothetical protein
MAITFALPVGLENVDGSINVDETVSTINLRSSPYSSATYNGTLIDHGVYQFTSVDSGEYKVYSSSTELTIFGIIKVGEHNAVMITGNQTIAGIKTFSNQMVLSAGVQTDTISEKTSTAGVTIDGVLIKDSLDGSSIVAKTGAQTIAGKKTFTNDIATDYIYEDTSGAGVTFPDDPTTIGTLVLSQMGSNINMAGYRLTNLSAPTSGSHAATKTYVDAITLVPFQESPNIIRCIYSGTQVNGQAYTTYLACLSYAMLVPATSTNIITIEFKGMGTAGLTAIDMVSYDAGGGAMFLDDYIHLTAVNQSVVLTPPDDTVSVSTLGTSIISNFKIYRNDAGSDPIFTNIEFNNCYFDLTVNSVTFNTCKFKNCEVKVNNDGDNTATFTTCKGNLIACNQSVGTSTIDSNTKSKTEF